MDEDEVIILEDGKKICPWCLVGEIKILGGPIAVGIGGATDPDVLFLCHCDICNTHYQLKDETFRQDILRRHAGQYGLPVLNNGN